MPSLAFRLETNETQEIQYIQYMDEIAHEVFTSECLELAETLAEAGYPMCPQVGGGAIDLHLSARGYKGPFRLHGDIDVIVPDTKAVAHLISNGYILTKGVPSEAGNVQDFEGTTPNNFELGVFIQDRLAFEPELLDIAGVSVAVCPLEICYLEKLKQIYSYKQKGLAPRDKDKWDLDAFAPYVDREILDVHISRQAADELSAGLAAVEELFGHTDGRSGVARLIGETTIPDEIKSKLLGLLLESPDFENFRSAATGLLLPTYVSNIYSRYGLS